MLTEDKIIEHANFLLDKKTLMPAEYPGWISGATWANGENAQHLAKIERVKELYLRHWNLCIENSKRDDKKWNSKYVAALELAQEYKDQSDSQKEQIAELVAALKHLNGVCRANFGIGDPQVSELLKRYENE